MMTKYLHCLMGVWTKTCFVWFYIKPRFKYCRNSGSPVIRIYFSWPMNTYLQIQLERMYHTLGQSYWVWKYQCNVINKDRHYLPRLHNFLHFSMWASCIFLRQTVRDDQNPSIHHNCHQRYYWTFSVFKPHGTTVIQASYGYSQKNITYNSRSTS